MSKRALTWRTRRRGRTPPLAAWAPIHGVWRQATLPSLPATTLWPPTTSSISHLSGTICHITKQPFCETPVGPTAVDEPLDPSSSTIAILTFPVANTFFTLPSSFRQPVAAVKCCIMYSADDETYQQCHNPNQEKRRFSHQKWRIFSGEFLKKERSGLTWVLGWPAWGEIGKRGQPRTLKRIFRSDFLLKSREKWLFSQFLHEFTFLELLLLSSSSSFVGSSDKGASRFIWILILLYLRKREMRAQKPKEWKTA